MHDLETRFMAGFYGVLGLLVIVGMSVMAVVSDVTALMLIVVPLLLCTVVMATIFRPER